MTQEMWDDAQKEVERELADSGSTTEEGSEVSEETPTTEGNSEVSNAEAAPQKSSRNTLDLENSDEVAEYLTEHPEEAKDVLVDMKAHQDAVKGTENSKLLNLQQNLLNLQQQIAQREAQPQTNPGEPDEYGLTPAQYDELDKIISKLPSQRVSQQANQTVQDLSVQKQLDQVWETVRTEYGEAFTPARQKRAERILRKANWNLNDPDVVADYQEIKVEMDAAKRNTRTEKVQEEKNTRSNAQKRVAASSSQSIVPSTLNTEDVNVLDGKGNISMDEMLKTEKALRRKLDRMG